MVAVVAADHALRHRLSCIRVLQSVSHARVSIRYLAYLAKAPPQPRWHTRDSPFAGKPEDGDDEEMLNKWKKRSKSKGKKAKKPLGSAYTSDHLVGRSNMSGDLDLDV